MKGFFIGLIVGSCLIASCKDMGLDVKVYVSKVLQGGLVRAQAHEVVTYDKTDGYICFNPDDGRIVIERLVQCQQSPELQEYLDDTETVQK